MQRWLSSGHLPPIGNPWKGTSTPDVNYYMTINAIFISIVLLIPAIGAFVLRRPAGAGPVWLMFWTAAWFAFVVHLWYGVDHVLGGVAQVFHDSASPPRVTNPVGDTVTVAVVDGRCGARLEARLPCRRRWRSGCTCSAARCTP